MFGGQALLVAGMWHDAAAMRRASRLTLVRAKSGAQEAASPRAMSPRAANGGADGGADARDARAAEAEPQELDLLVSQDQAGGEVALTLP